MASAPAPVQVVIPDTDSDVEAEQIASQVEAAAPAATRAVDANVVAAIARFVAPPLEDICFGGRVPHCEYFFIDGIFVSHQQYSRVVAACSDIVVHICAVIPHGVDSTCVGHP